MKIFKTILAPAFLLLLTTLVSIIEVPYHTASRMGNGKITFMRYWYDMLNILQTQGFKVTPPGN